jgi:hypothetical protein
MKPQCDDAGRIRASSRKLARTLYPYDDDAVTLINTWLADLVRHRCASVYEVEGERYLQLPYFNSEERIDKPSASRLPGPEGATLISAQVLIDESPLANPREPSRDLASLREPSRDVASPREPSRDTESEPDQQVDENPREPSRDFANPRSGREGKGREGIVGRGVGKPFELGLDLDPPNSVKSKARSKLPPIYPFTSEHEKVGCSILPAEADVAKLFDQFTAYWHSNGEMKADWHATWRTWCHNAINRGYPRKPDPEAGNGRKRYSIIDEPPSDLPRKGGL